jgi:seryl-tRNA synthetase
MTAAPIREHAELSQFEATDAAIREMALSEGARETAYPVLIARDVLRAAEYDRAFPHLLMAGVTACDPCTEPERLFNANNLSEPKWFLSPAVCYHSYAQFAGRALAGPVTLTARGKCFRNEDRTLSFGRRQIEFEMREIVLLGTKEWIEERLPAFQTQVEALASKFGFAGEWEIAEDPFFLPRAQGKALMQRLLKTKREFCVDGLAIASINRHGTFFGERFHISDESGAPVHTACIAFGLDRWAAIRTV